MNLYTAGGVKMRLKNKKKPPAVWKIVVKYIIVICLSIPVLSTMFGMYASVKEEEENLDKADLINWCNQQYYDREFADLSETLMMYRPDDNEFDKYWEIKNGYEDYLKWRQWDKAVTLNLEQSVEKEAFYRNKVNENVKNAKFEQNEKFLKEFQDKMNKN